MILAFPQQIATLKEPLQRFITEVFHGSRFEQPVKLRGVYLSSGTQEGTPIDRIMGSMAAAFGLGPIAATAGGAQGKSYFITQPAAQGHLSRESTVGGRRPQSRAHQNLDTAGSLRRRRPRDRCGRLPVGNELYR